MEYETPTSLASRLRLGREEFLQRLLTTLILDAPYPRWNTRSTPSPEGIAFLESLWVLSGFDDWPAEAPAFVDEFDLPRRSEDEQGGAPDYAVLWDDRLWIIELKTEAGSHRRDQIPYYFELARHHHPDLQLEVTYLTPPLKADPTPQALDGRFAHVTWDAVAPLIAESWPRPDTAGQREVVEGLIDAVGRLDERPSEYLESLRAVPPPESPDHDPVQEALRLAEETAEDGKQRCLDHTANDLESMQALRLQVRQALAATPPESGLRHVMPWIWTTTSGGRHMTAAGDRTGAELRLSRYRQPLY